MLIIGDRRFLNLEEAVRYLMNQREAGAGFNIAGLAAAQEDITSPIEGSIYGIGTSPDYTYYLYKDATFKLLGNFKGPTGQTGLTGNDGATGEKGNQGNKGIKGNDGATGAGVGTIDNLDLSTGEADVLYEDGIATIHNSGDIIYNGVTHEEIITDFQIPIEGKDGIIIEADSTGKKIEVGIDSEILNDRLDADFNKLVRTVKESVFENSTLEIPNTGEGFLNDFNIKGKSIQIGEPAPNNHIDIDSTPAEFNVISENEDASVSVTLPYRLEAVDVAEYANFASLPATGVYGTQYKTLDDGKLWQWAGSCFIEFALRSLPDGTADEVDWDNYLLQPYTARIKVQPSFSDLTGAAWQREGHFSCYYVSTTIPTAVSNSSNLRCTHFKGGAWEWSGKTFPNSYILVNGSLTSVSTHIYIIAPNDIFGIVSEDTDAEKLAKVNIWFTNNDVYLEYQLRTPPEPIPIRKYGETYDDVVWDKNEPIPTQSGYTTVYTDASPQPILVAKEYTIAQLGDIRVLKNAGDESFNPLTTTDAVYNRLTHKTLEEENAERDAELNNLSQKVPDAPDSDGAYTLKCTVTSGAKAYQWIKDIV